MQIRFTLYRFYFSKSLFCIFAFILSSENLLAHGGLHERIIETTAEIAENPDSAYLYLKRGKIYLQHEVYDSSLVDLRQCERLGYSDVLLDLTFIQTLHHLDRNNEALTYAQKILCEDPINVRAFKLQGKVYFSLAQYEQAAESFEKVILHSNKTFPFNYIDASIAWQKAETEAGRQNAILAIQDGIQKLGPLVTLYERLVSLGEFYEDYNLAIENQTKLVHKLSRKEHVLYNRGLIYQKLCRADLAKEDFMRARDLVYDLPLRHQNKPAIKKLKASLEQMLK